MTVTAQPDLRAIKSRQQMTWSSGNFGTVASRIVLVSEQLAESADLAAGSRVLDVACGTGNAAIAAARSGTDVVGIDYVPALLETGRQRAEIEGLPVEFREGDAEDLPVADGEFDAVLSVFGSMFAPDQPKAASELARACRPGGTIALASWMPSGFIGDMFRVIAKHVPPPPGLSSPMLWGTEAHLQELFGDSVASMRSTERICTFRYPSAEAFVEFFRRWYGPTLKAFEAVGPDREPALHADLVELANRWDARKDGRAIAIPSAYLETVMQRAG